jgi:hypothetical protein
MCKGKYPKDCVVPNYGLLYQQNHRGGKATSWDGGRRLQLLDVYCILYFPHLLGGFLHICTMYMYYICGLWPPDNVGCLFITWYQSPGLGHPPHAATRVDPKFSFSSISSSRPRLLPSLSPAVLVLGLASSWSLQPPPQS